MSDPDRERDPDRDPVRRQGRPAPPGHALRRHGGRRHRVDLDLEPPEPQPPSVVVSGFDRG